MNAADPAPAAPRLGTELLRKAVHVGMGGFALLLRWLAPWEAAVCAATALAFNLLLLHRMTRKSLLREDERDRGYSPGIALYPAVVLAAVVVFHDRLELAAAVWGLLAVGDGMATVCGVLVGGARLPWNRSKSWAGLVAFVLWGTAAAAFLIRWTQQAVPDAAVASRAGTVDWIGESFLAGGTIPAAALLLLGCFAAAAAAGLTESARTGIDDNILVPLVGGAVLYAATLVDPGRVAAAAGALGPGALVGVAVNVALAVAALATRGVGMSGAVWGAVLGSSLWVLAGWRGFLMLLLFFVLGTATTRIGYARKAALGVAQERGGRRGARNAFANVGAGVAFAFLALSTSSASGWTVAMVAAFATAAMDTVSSEFGQAFGRRHHLITTFRRVTAGTEGAVSIEGTLAGIVAAATIAAAAAAVGLVGAAGAAAVTLGAFAGGTFESYLGALGRKAGELDNELLNFANTVVGGVCALALYGLIA